MISVHKERFGFPVWGFETKTDIDFISTNVWSACIWAGGARQEANFTYAQYAVLDYDEGVTLNEALEMFKDYKKLVGVTKSHGIEKGNKPACDRFRVLLWFEEPIYDLDIYRYNMAILTQKYKSDLQPIDGGRIWQPCREIISVSQTGKLVPVLKDVPKEYTTVYKNEKIVEYTNSWKAKMDYPPRVKSTLRGNFMPGTRNKELFFTACFLLNTGNSLHETKKMLERVPGMIEHEGFYDTLKSAAKKCGVSWC